MAKPTPKHTEEIPITIDRFHGGINMALPASLIEIDECEQIDNFYYHPGDSRLKTRFPLKKYNNSTPSTSPVTGLYYWNDEWYYTMGTSIYYLDASDDGVEISGTLTGSSKPTFCPFGNVLLVASGGTLQQINTSRVLSNVTNGPKGKYIYQHSVSLVLGGDPDNKDRIHQSGPGNHQAWTTGIGDYADVGYLDKLEIVGCTEYAEGLYIVFKRGDDELRTYFVTDLSVPSPMARKVSTIHAARSHYSVVDVLSKMYFLEDKNVSMIVDTDRSGKLAVDSTVGFKLANNINSTATCHAVVYPPHGQIWFIPDPTINVGYICHYLRKNAWTRFTFGSRKIYSTFFRPYDNILYVGCDDGNIYKYDTTAIDYQDEGGSNYSQSIKTRIFDEPAHREKVLKAPMLFYEALADGSFTFKVMKSYGRTSAFSSTVSMTANSRYLYDLQGTDIYDTQDGGDDEMFLYDPSVITYKNFNENIPTDNFQFRLDVASGGMRVDKFIGKLAPTGYRPIG